MLWSYQGRSEQFTWPMMLTNERVQLREAAVLKAPAAPAREEASIVELRSRRHRQRAQVLSCVHYAFDAPDELAP